MCSLCHLTEAGAALRGPLLDIASNVRCARLVGRAETSVASLGALQGAIPEGHS
jgi:hypothetical protein